MSTMENADEIRRLVAEEVRRHEHDPRRAGALDVTLLSVAIGAAVIFGMCLTILTVSHDRFPIDDGRIVLTMAAAATCVSPVMLGLWGVTRTHRKRHEQLMEKLDRIRCDCPNARDSVDSPAVHELVGDVYRLARRQRRADDN